MTTELRVLRPEDLDPWFQVPAMAFGGALEDPEERAKWRGLVEPDRKIGAWDGEEVVGTAGTFTFRVSVPGGTVVPAAGVTMVAVKPTHRRRGVLRSMMRRQLDDVRSWGEPLAVLTASEPAIYGRFGYGVATERMAARIDTDRVSLTVPPDADGLRLRLVDPADAAVRESCEELYARRVPRRPGMLERRPGWQQVPLHDPEQQRHGASPLQCVLAEQDGAVRGFARYAVLPDWDAAGPRGEVQLRDMEAVDPAAYGALLRYLSEIDLTSWLKIDNCPVDDAWQHMVSDIRRCGVGLRDAMYVRLVELGAALEARTYTAPVDVVLDVEDDFCPWNAGRWRLTGDAKGAACERTTDPADLALSVRELGSAYLGGASLRSLADAGLVRELRQGALAEASVAFRNDPAPWLPHGF